MSQLPPQLPPRNFPSNDIKDAEAKTAEQPSKSLPDTMLTRLQQLDTSTYGLSFNISNINHSHLIHLWGSSKLTEARFKYFR